MKKRNQKLQEDSSCHEENLKKATCNEDFDTVDTIDKSFFKENSVDILPSPLLVLSKEDAMKLTRKDLEENTFYVMKSDDEKKYAKVKVEDEKIRFEDWEEGIEGGSACIDFLDFISFRTSVIDTHKFIEEHKKKLHKPKLPTDRIKFSKIEVKEIRVYFHSFETSDGGDFVLEFGSLLKTLGCCSVLPVEAFLKIESSSGEVVITTDGGSSRALNFLLLASGIMDDSYQGTLSYGGNTTKGPIVRGGFNKERLGFPGVVEGIQNGKIYRRRETKRGDVEGWNAKVPNHLSYFRIRKEDSSDPSTSTFGRVKQGMKVVDHIIREGDSVKECGLHFDI